MNTLEYIEEIKGIAANLVCEAMQTSDNDREEAEELINDSFLHETIDGHQWVIYYSYNNDVIENSQNDEYYREIYDNESIGQIVADKGLDDLKTVIAYWAMYADVQEELEAAFDEYENNQEEENDWF